MILIDRSTTSAYNVVVLLYTGQQVQDSDSDRGVDSNSDRGLII